MRRLGTIPPTYLAAIGVALVVGTGIYALRSSPSPIAHSAGPARTQTAPGPTNTGPSATEHLGAQLLARAHQAYVHVPAIVVTGQVGAMSLRFTEILRGGRTTKEAFQGTEGNQITGLVAPNGTPTFAREPGSSCWRTLSPSNPQSLTDTGQQFPEVPSNASVQTVEKTPSGWMVQLTANGRQATVAIDHTTYLVSTIVATDGNSQATEHIEALSAAPTLPVPTPHC